MSATGGSTNIHGRRPSKVTAQCVNLSFHALSLVVILMMTCLFSTISVALPIIIDQPSSDHNNSNSKNNTVSLSHSNSSDTLLISATDSNNLLNSTTQSLNTTSLLPLTESELNKHNGSSLAGIAKTEVKNAAKHLGVSLVSGLVGSSFAQGLYKGQWSPATAETGGGGLGTTTKVTTLTALDKSGLNNTMSIDPASNATIIDQGHPKFDKKKLAKTVVPALVAGSAASLAAFGVITAMGGPRVDSFMAANAVASVVWNRTQTEINRKVFGVGLRNKTADTRTRLERIKDTAIGLVPNIVGGAMNGMVGGAIVGKIGANAALNVLGDRGRTILGETLSSGFGGMTQEETVRAVRAAANHIDSPITSIMRGDTTRNFTMSASDNTASFDPLFAGGTSGAVSKSSAGSSTGRSGFAGSGNGGK
ncbi:hypothetical protein BDF19DRAFT_452211 [Syncephalis fuscata]|nr:hypothetical protein BDF19DRAFT_452211 [Syncephalis fuscata]